MRRKFQLLWLAAPSLVALQHAQCLVHLRLQLVVRFEEDEELAVVHFEHHAGDLARQLGLVLGNGGEQLLPDHLLLNAGRRGGQLRRIQRPARSRHGLLLLRRHLLLLRASRHRGAGAHGHLLHGRAHHAHGAGHWIHACHAHHARAAALARHHARASFAHHAHHLWAAHHGTSLRPHHCSRAVHGRGGLWRHHAHHGPHHAHHLRAALPHHGHVRGHATHLWPEHLWHHATLPVLAALATLHAGHAASCRGVALAQALLPGLALLGEANVQRLALNDLEVHLGNCLGCLVRRSKAHETEALALALVVSGRCHGSDGTEGLKQGAQGGLVRVFIKVLHIEIHALLLGGGILRSRELVTKLCLALLLRLCTLRVELANWVAIHAHLVLLALLFCLLDFFRRTHLLHVQGLNRLLGLLVRLKVDKCKLAAPVVCADSHGGDRAETLKFFGDCLLTPAVREVFHVDISEICDVWALPVATLDELAHLDRLLTDLHAIDTLDGLLGSLLRLVVDKPVPV
mmetsp:Transcript_65763/g.148385  ORF Transcript_65763/g.148385 Transcript_65763/m.148385 type:complete len:515 (+) Transcript_65763:89-1633(+)